MKKISTLISKINQELYNKGLNKNTRLDIICNFIKNSDIKYKNLTEKTYEYLNKLNKIIKTSENDIIQQLFMLLGRKILKVDFNQFYTPYTICEFLGNITEHVGLVIEPACGLADLIINISSDKYILRDIDNNIIDRIKLNIKINKLDINKFDIKIEDSLENIYNYKADVGVMNPPFGVKTNITDKNILNKYYLSFNKEKQQIGILFIEKLLKEIKDGGITYMILPSGYLSTKTISVVRKYIIHNYKILFILELPQNTFKRSGTGVDTCILCIQKIKDDTNYKILIEKINYIGYDLSSNKTPYLYKVDKNGNFLLENDNKILKNDLVELQNKISKFAYDYNINYLKKKNLLIKYKTINKNEITETYNFSISKFYIEKNKEDIELINLDLEIIKDKTIINKSKEYIYLSIKEINRGTYNINNILPGWKLPNRATYSVKKNDILISKLKGKTSFCIIQEDFGKIIVTNGVFIIRLKKLEERLLLIYNLYNNYLNTQLNLLTNGSIMATIDEESFKKIKLKPLKKEKIKTMENLLKILDDKHKILSEICKW